MRIVESKFVYTTALKKIRNMTKRIKVVQGGTSSSKTFSIIPILIDICIKNPGVSCSIVAESHPHLRKGALRDFLNIMKMTNRYIDENWNRSNSIYKFSNESFIEFFSADSSDKLRGARRNYLFINECNNITNEAYTQLAMRTSHDIFLDFNPSHEFWITEVLESDESEQIILTYRDNEAIDESVLNFLLSKRKLAETSDYWKNWCNVYLDGIPGKLSGLIFQNYSLIDNIPQDAQLLGYGLDFGFTNDPTAVVALYKYNKNIIVDEIMYKKGYTNSEIYNYLKNKIDINTQIYADSAEPKSIRELQLLGLSIYPTVKGRDSIKFGIDILQNYQIYVTSNSDNLLKELNNYSWKKDKSGNDMNTPIDSWNHLIDSLRYISVIKLKSGSEFYNPISEKVVVNSRFNNRRWGR